MLSLPYQEEEMVDPATCRSVVSFAKCRPAVPALLAVAVLNRIFNILLKIGLVAAATACRGPHLELQLPH